MKIGLGLVEQHDAQRADHRAVGVAQRNAADDEGAGAVGQQVDQDRLAGFEHLVHLGVLHHGRHRMAYKILFAGETQRRQEAAVGTGQGEALQLPAAARPQAQRAAGHEKPKTLGWMVGQIMKASKGKANPTQVNELLRAKLAG